MNNILKPSKPIFNSAWFLWLILLSISLSGCKSIFTPTVETPQVEETLAPERTAIATQAATATAPRQTPVPLLLDPDDLAGLSIRFMHPWAGAHAEVIENIAMEFSLSNPWDIWVDVEAFGSETVLVEQLQLDIDGSDVPGLIAVHPYQLSIMNDELFTVSLTNYFSDPDWGFTAEAQADIPPVFLEQFTVDDNLMALPVAPQATVIFYNQSWGEALGFSAPPNDERSFREQACDATFANLEDINDANDGVGGWLINFDPNVLLGWYSSFEGELPGDGLPTFNNDAGQDAFGYLKSAYDQGCFWIGRQPDPYVYFADRYALMYAGALSQIPAQSGWMDAAGSEDEWTVIGFPGPGGETIMVDSPGLFLTAETPEKQMAAWLFARHLLEPDVQAKIVRSMFTLPVRKSSMDSLSDFETDYPQWAQGVSLIDTAEPVPSSDSWAIAQWVLQDAVDRLVRQETVDIPAMLDILDDTIRELEEMAP